MADEQYKFRREDFGALPVKLNHLTIYLNFLEDVVEAENCLEMEANSRLDRLQLDAKDLEILKIAWLPEGADPSNPEELLEYEYLRSDDKLVVTLPRTVDSGEGFRIRTLTRCIPSDHILEGIYKDTTPGDAPQQYVSQCQQWGFQRIMPIFDDCRAKCTMTTTIEADARYTHLISNGNISREHNPSGVPVPKPGDPGRQIITYENPIPMAPYLFIACAGTWDTLVDQVTYDTGRTVRLEYLVPPGRAEDARIPMEILKESVLWIKKSQDYEYKGDTYRTICMNKSNFGGMENVGNTTIVTDAALIDEHTLDQSLIYAYAVIVHEFEHNQCGSETTMESPFDVWLNEAYTVDVERQFTQDTFDPTFIRLNQVDSIRNPLLGPLAIEDGGRAGRIVREGFNDPDELIDGVTYVKAAEVIRMLRLILGPEVFRSSTELYFSRYKNSNANTDQFFECLEEVSGRSLDQFKKGWLYTVGYPKVAAETTYDEQKQQFSVKFTQETDTELPVFHLPIEVALIDSTGSTIDGTERVFALDDREGEFTFDGLKKPPAFASLNRDYSFYGTFRVANVEEETLTTQARLDTNPFNQVEAMRQLTDTRRVKLLLEPEGTVDKRWLDLYGDTIARRDLSSGLKAYFLRVEEQPLDRRYSTWYPELVTARETLMKAVNAAHKDLLVDHFNQLDTYGPRATPKDGIEDRILKHVLLDMIAVDDTPESHQLIIEHLNSATTNADRLSALLALNRSSAPDRRAMLEDTYEKWRYHLSGYANYLRIISSGTRNDVFDMIEAEKVRPTFDINQPTWSRALLLPMAMNNKMLWTDDGISWMTNTIIEVSAINPYTTGRLLNSFQHVGRLKRPLKAKVVAALESILASVSEGNCPSVFGQASSYLGRS